MILLLQPTLVLLKFWKSVYGRLDGTLGALESKYHSAKAELTIQAVTEAIESRHGVGQYF